MSKKLYELVSNTIGGKFKFMDKELILDRVTVGKLVELENEGQDIQELMNNFSAKPATISTKLGWLLLSEESKSEFNNDYHVFIGMLQPSDMEILSNAVIEAVTNSKPVEEIVKNEVGATV